MAYHIGRFQIGDQVPVVARFTNRQGSPLEPLFAPVCVVTPCAGGATIARFSMPISDRSRVTGFFIGQLSITNLYAPGDYLCVVEASVDGKPQVQSSRFTLLPGGDAVGEVQAIESWERPEVIELVMQRSGGTLASGRNPSIPTQE